MGPFRPVVRTSAFHVEDAGSIPVRDRDLFYLSPKVIFGLPIQGKSLFKERKKADFSLHPSSE